MKKKNNSMINCYTPNKPTLKVIADVRKGIGITKYSTSEEMMEGLRKQLEEETGVKYEYN